MKVFLRTQFLILILALFLPSGITASKMLECDEVKRFFNVETRASLNLQSAEMAAFMDKYKGNLNVDCDANDINFIKFEIVVNDYKGTVSLEIQEEGAKIEESQVIKICFELISNFGENGFSYFECREITEEDFKGQFDKEKVDGFKDGEKLTIINKSVSLDILSGELMKMTEYIKSGLEKQIKLDDVKDFLNAKIKETGKEGTDVKSKIKEGTASESLHTLYLNDGSEIDIKIDYLNENIICLGLNTKLGTKEILVSRFKSNSERDVPVPELLEKKYGEELKKFLDEVTSNKDASEKEVKSISLPMLAMIVDKILEYDVVDAPQKEGEAPTNDIVRYDYDKIMERSPIDLESPYEIGAGEAKTFENLNPNQCFGSLSNEPKATLKFGPFFGDGIEVDNILLADETLICPHADGPCTLEAYLTDKKVATGDINQETQETFNKNLFKKVTGQVKVEPANYNNVVTLAYLFPSIFRMMFIKIVEIETLIFDGFLLKINNQFTKSEFLIPNGSFNQNRDLVKDLVAENVQHYFRMIEATWTGKKTDFAWEKVDEFKKSVVDELAKSEGGSKPVTCSDVVLDEPKAATLKKLSCEGPAVSEGEGEKAGVKAGDVIVVSISKLDKGGWKILIATKGAFNSQKRQATISIDVRPKYEYDFKSILIQFISSIIKKHFGIPVSEVPKVNKGWFLGEPSKSVELKRDLKTFAMKSNRNRRVLKTRNASKRIEVQPADAFDLELPHNAQHDTIFGKMGLTLKRILSGVFNSSESLGQDNLRNDDFKKFIF